MDSIVSESARSLRAVCANCEHCKLVRAAVGNGQQYQLRIRCAAGLWKKKGGDEKLHKYFTLPRRVYDHCPGYVPMGDARAYMRDLRATLPTRDEVYSD